MIDIDIRADVKAAERMLRGFRNQIPFATAKALTDTGAAIKKAERRQIVQKFDRPVRRTQTSVYLKRATKRRQEVDVWIVDDGVKGTAPVKYLAPQIGGGPRNRTRFERALEHAGILGSNEWVMPSKYAKRNSYGNVTPGTYTRVLSQLRASRDPGQNRTTSRRSKKSRRAIAYFYGRDHAPRGIWERRGNSVRPLFVFVTDTPTYRKRFRFFKTAQGVVNSTWRKNFREALAYAIKTAK